MEFTLNYKIPDKGWLAPVYVDEDPVENVVKKLVAYKRIIKNAYAAPENEIFFEGYAEYHKLIYLLESLVGEGNIAGSTTLEQLETFLRCSDGSRTSHKVRNLGAAMNHLFSNCFNFADSQSQLPIERLTPEFIQKIYKEVAEGLMDSPGMYRETESAPSNESWTYLRPQQIPDCLDSLCKFTRDAILKEESEDSLDSDRFTDRVKIVAMFLTNFLHIHPFTNGNGRVARLVISWLMSDIFIVPVPLFSSLSSRQTYLDCIRDSRCSTPFKPENLSRLILESVYHTHRQVCISLDLIGEFQSSLMSSSTTSSSSIAISTINKLYNFEKINLY